MEVIEYDQPMHRDMDGKGGWAEVILRLKRPMQHPGDETNHSSPVSGIVSAVCLAWTQRMKILYALKNTRTESVDGLLESLN